MSVSSGSIEFHKLLVVQVSDSTAKLCPFSDWYGVAIVCFFACLLQKKDHQGEMFDAETLTTKKAAKNRHPKNLIGYDVFFFRVTDSWI